MRTRSALLMQEIAQLKQKPAPPKAHAAEPAEPAQPAKPAAWQARGAARGGGLFRPGRGAQPDGQCRRPLRRHRRPLPADGRLLRSCLRAQGRTEQRFRSRPVLVQPRGAEPRRYLRGLQKGRGAAGHQGGCRYPLQPGRRVQGDGPARRCHQRVRDDAPRTSRSTFRAGTCSACATWSRAITRMRSSR